MGRFPTDFPSAEVQMLAGTLLGRTPTTADAIEAGWWVAGYAASQVLKAGQPITMGAGEEVMDREHLGLTLEGLKCCEGEGMKAIDWTRWQKILQALLTILPILFGEAA